jgi:hypothetical protein
MIIFGFLIEPHNHHLFALDRTTVSYAGPLLPSQAGRRFSRSSKPPFLLSLHICYPFFSCDFYLNFAIGYAWIQIKW